MVEIFEVGPCENGYQMGFLIGQRFSNLIRTRVSKDIILQNQTRPFAQSSPESEQFITTLSAKHRNKFPGYWDELLGTAEGSGVPVLDIILVNFRTEILALTSKTEIDSNDIVNVDTPEDDCCDVLVVNDSMAIAAHNEDGDFDVIGNTYLLRCTLSNGLSFMAYSYPGELPTCAFGFNSYGVAFMLNTVAPMKDEIAADGIGRNFISRGLLEATDIDDALLIIRSSEAPVGHNYNLIDVKTRRILNVETASRNRVSVRHVGATPFFHTNMYLHLHDQVHQVQDEHSICKEKRAAVLPKETKDDILSLLGDTSDAKYPHLQGRMFEFDLLFLTLVGLISGLVVYTLCTAVINLDEQTLKIIEGNPKKGQVSHVFSMSS